MYIIRVSEGETLYWALVVRETVSWAASKTRRNLRSGLGSSHLLKRALKPDRKGKE